MDETSTILLPIFNENEPLYIYLDKMDEYRRKINKSKYDIVLKFMNEFTSQSAKSLSQIKPFNKNKIIECNNYIIEILKLHDEVIYQTFNVKLIDYIDLSLYDDNFDEIFDTNFDSIIKYIKIILWKIDYKITASRDGQIYKINYHDDYVENV